MLTITQASLTTLLTTAGVPSASIFAPRDNYDTPEADLILRRLKRQAPAFLAALNFTYPDHPGGPGSIVRAAAWFFHYFTRSAPIQPLALAEFVTTVAGAEQFYLLAVLDISGTATLAYYGLSPSLDAQGFPQLDI